MKTEQEIITKCLSILKNVRDEATPDYCGRVELDIYIIDKVITLLEIISEKE